MPYRTAASAQRSANATAWSTKKSIDPPVSTHHKLSAESPRRGRLSITSAADAPRSGVGLMSLFGLGLADRLRVRELEVRPRLLEVADEPVVDAGPAEHRLERPPR